MKWSPRSGHGTLTYNSRNRHNIITRGRLIAELPGRHVQEFCTHKAGSTNSGIAKVPPFMGVTGAFGVTMTLFITTWGRRRVFGIGLQHNLV